MSGSLGMIASSYDNEQMSGRSVAETTGSPHRARLGAGAPLSGYAGSVEGTLGQVAGALDMQGLASGTGYLDLEAQEIQGAQPAGTGSVDGIPVTIYKLSQSGLQDPDVSGLTRQQVEIIQAGTPSSRAAVSPGRRPGSPLTPRVTSENKRPSTPSRTAPR